MFTHSLMLCRMRSYRPEISNSPISYEVRGRYSILTINRMFSISLIILSLLGDLMSVRKRIMLCAQGTVNQLIIMT